MLDENHIGTLLENIIQPAIKIPFDIDFELQFRLQPLNNSIYFFIIGYEQH